MNPVGMSVLSMEWQFLLGFCAEKDISVSFMTEYGRFLASVKGPVSGNVLLRREQYRKADDPDITKNVASNIIAAKIANSRTVINRAIRDHGDKIDIVKLKNVTRQLEKFIIQLKKVNTVDEVNAMLSFTYTILGHDIRSALETVGLDPAVGFLHCDRPGRPGLALDLMEEFRSVIADRQVLSLINRKQVKPSGFKKAENGVVVMDSDTRKILLTEYQNRKQTEVYHPYVEEKVKIGLLFFIQAELLARYLRGDMDGSVLI
jgi:CRISPR-associated protein Cas1